MQGLADLEATSALMDAVPLSKAAPGCKRTKRLFIDASAGGGLLIDDRGKADLDACRSVRQLRAQSNRCCGGPEGQLFNIWH
jgi:hypothetical protein